MSSIKVNDEVFDILEEIAESLGVTINDAVETCIVNSADEFYEDGIIDEQLHKYIKETLYR